MRFCALLLITLSSSAIAEVTEQTKEYPHDGIGNDVIKSHLVLRDGEILVSSVDFAKPDGTINQRNHTLHVGGEMVAVLEDDDADGTLNGLSVFNTEAGEMEYLYVQDGLRFVPASSDEMVKAKAIGEIAASLMDDAISGESVTPFKVIVLRLRVWLLKWDVPLFLCLGVVAMAGFGLGRRSSKSRSEQDDAGKPDPVSS